VSSYLHLSIENYQDKGHTLDLVDAERKEPKAFIQKLIKYLSGLESGSERGRIVSMIEDDAGTQATWTIAFTRANAAGNYVTVGAGRKTATATTTNASTSLTNVSNTVDMKVGDVISGTGIPVGTTIASLSGSPGSATVVLSAAATASATVTVTVYERATTFLEGVDFVRGADDTATGANLAAAINANITAYGSLYGLFTSAGAAAVTGTITLIALAKSAAGRFITFDTDDATAFAITNSVVGAAGSVHRGAIVHNFGMSI
jgi:hypothetical protein